MTLWGKQFRLTAERAWQLGLVDELVEPDRLVETALEMGAQVARCSPAAVALSKQAIWASLGRRR
ncbi:MAG TPA: hypothetical protein PLV68_16240, partial [Ilumatobacteraceae bacterium]|nr:hypothetical protein [Ilumatobacteraceae bacterium]